MLARRQNVNNIWHVTRRLTALRLLFLSATMLALASLVVLVIQGLVGFQDSIKDYETTEDATSAAIESFTAATSSLIVAGTDLVQVRREGRRCHRFRCRF